MMDTVIPGPDLSVLLVCPRGRTALHRSLAAIAAQTIAHRIEVVIVSPDDDYATAEAALLARFHSTTVHVEPAITNVDEVVGRRLAACAAPIVAAIEDHAFPEPEWAEQLLAAWDGTSVAIGSVIVNANPRSMLSWSNLLVAYGQWSDTTPAGPISWVPMHNCAYRKAVLLALGDTLKDQFNREGTILTRLREAGGTFLFAPLARIRHLNPSSWQSTARLRIDAGRLSAANRWSDEGWGLPKRLAFAVLGPLIPLVRYRRMRRDLFGTSPEVSEARLGPALLVGLAFDGMGQIAGFLSGPGDARARLSVFEMDRMAHLDRRDFEVFRPQGASVPA